MTFIAKPESFDAALPEMAATTVPYDPRHTPPYLDRVFRFRIPAKGISQPDAVELDRIRYRRLVVTRKMQAVKANA